MADKQSLLGNIDHQSIARIARGEAVAPAGDEDGELSTWDRITNIPGVVAEGIANLPGGVWRTVRGAWSGGDINPMDEEDLARRRKEAGESAARVKDWSERSFEGLGNALESAPYSVANMIPQAVKAGGPLGAVVGGAASLIGTARTTKDQFLWDIYEKAAQEMGRELTPEEWGELRSKYEDAANKYGAWEAIPETVGNRIFMGLLGEGGTKLVRAVGAKSMPGKAATRYLATNIEEQTGETATQWGQGNLEYEAGLRDNPLTIGEAFAEQAPTTLWTTGLFGIGGGAVRGVHNVRSGRGFFDDGLTDEERGGRGDLLNQPQGEQSPEEFVGPNPMSGDQDTVTGRNWPVPVGEAFDDSQREARRAAQDGSQDTVVGRNYPAPAGYRYSDDVIDVPDEDIRPIREPSDAVALPDGTIVTREQWEAAQAGMPMPEAQAAIGYEQQSPIMGPGEDLLAGGVPSQIPGVQAGPMPASAGASQQVNTQAAQGQGFGLQQALPTQPRLALPEGTGAIPMGTERGGAPIATPYAPTMNAPIPQGGAARAALPEGRGLGLSVYGDAAAPVNSAGRQVPWGQGAVSQVQQPQNTPMQQQTVTAPENLSPQQPVSAPQTAKSIQEDAPQAKTPVSGAQSQETAKRQKRPVSEDRKAFLGQLDEQLHEVYPSAVINDSDRKEYSAALNRRQVKDRFPQEDPKASRGELIEQHAADPNYHVGDLGAYSGYDSQYVLYYDANPESRESHERRSRRITEPEYRYFQYLRGKAEAANQSEAKSSQSESSENEQTEPRPRMNVRQRTEPTRAMTKAMQDYVASLPENQRASVEASLRSMNTPFRTTAAQSRGEVMEKTAANPNFSVTGDEAGGYTLVLTEPNKKPITRNITKEEYDYFNHLRDKAEQAEKKRAGKKNGKSAEGVSKATQKAVEKAKAFSGESFKKYKTKKDGTKEFTGKYNMDTATEARYKIEADLRRGVEAGDIQPEEMSRLVSRMDDELAKMAPDGETTMFSLKGVQVADSSVTTGISKEKVESVVDLFRQKAVNMVETIVVAKQEDLPQRVRERAGNNRIEGVLYNGKVYLVAENISDARRASEVFIHEVMVHGGLRRMFKGDALNKVLDDLYQQEGGVAGHKGLRATAAKLRSQGRIKHDDAHLTKTEQRLLMEEHLAEEAEKSSLWKSFVKAIRDLINKTFGLKGDRMIGYTPTDMMLRQLHEHMFGGRFSVTKEEMAIMDKAGLTEEEKAEWTAYLQDKKAEYDPDDGWAELRLSKLKVTHDHGKRKITPEFKIVPYTFQQREVNGKLKAIQRGSKDYKSLVDDLAGKMVADVSDVYRRFREGDPGAQEIIRQARWYRAMRDRLRSEYGGFGDLLADLLGATSPNTPVRTNWETAIDALTLSSTGRYDSSLEEWEGADEYRKVIDDDLGTLVNTLKAEGKTQKEIKADERYKALLDEKKKLDKVIKAMKPKKSNDKLFGMNSNNVLRALLDHWREVRNPDPLRKISDTAPKAITFAGNLIGYRDKATIDVWAARMLQRLAGKDRVPPAAESSVAGFLREKGESTGQFGLGQDVFHEAARRIRESDEFADHKDLSTIQDDDLQAVAWFIEKEIWSQNGWTTTEGQGGSFETEADFEGNPLKSVIKELRATAMSKNSSEAKKAQALETLKGMKEVAQRWQGGISISREDALPQDAQQAAAARELYDALQSDNDVESIIAMRAHSTLGMYEGYGERSLDLEVVTRKGFSPAAVFQKMVELAKDHNQDSIFISRVLKDSEEPDLLRHRPGIEMYFRDAKSYEQLREDLEEGKKPEKLLNVLEAEGVSFYTLITDGRRNTQALSGAMPDKIVGIRFQFVPEFDEAYGSKVTVNGEEKAWSELSDEEIRKVMEDKRDEYRDLAKKCGKIEGISSSKLYHYATTVVFNNEYEGLTNDTGRTQEDGLRKAPEEGQGPQQRYDARLGSRDSSGREEGTSGQAGEGRQGTLELSDAESLRVGRTVADGIARAKAYREAGEANTDTGDQQAEAAEAGDVDIDPDDDIRFSIMGNTMDVMREAVRNPRTMWQSAKQMRAMRLANREDMSFFEKTFSQAQWLRKKYPIVDKLMGIQNDRDERRSELFQESIRDVDAMYRELRNDKKADKQLHDLIHTYDGVDLGVQGEHFEKQSTTTQSGNTVNRYTGLKDAYYKDLRKKVIDDQKKKGVDTTTPEFKKALDGFITIRKSLDLDVMHLFNQMIDNGTPQNKIDKFRTDIGLKFNYFPHMRFGDMYVKATDAQGNTLERIHFASTPGPGGQKLTDMDAALRVKELQKKYPNATIDYGKVEKMSEYVFEHTLHTSSLDQILTAAMDRLKNGGEITADVLKNMEASLQEMEKSGNLSQAELANLRQALADAKQTGKFKEGYLKFIKAAMQESIAETLQSRGFGQHLMKQKGVAGYEQDDIMRVLTSYKSSLYGYTTKMEATKAFGDALTDKSLAIDSRRNPKLYEWSRNFVQDMLRNSDDIDRRVSNLKNVMFVWYLGGNIKTACVNLTQNLITGVPRLAVETGMGNAAGIYFNNAGKALAQQVRDHMKGKPSTLTPDQKRLLEELYNKGVTQDKWTRELMGRWSGNGLLSRGWEKISEVMGIPMSVAERFNRTSLALAAFDAATNGKITNPATLKKYGKKPGDKWSYNEARDFAKGIIEDAHFIYSKSNRPELLRHGQFGRVLSSAYTFRSFAHGLLGFWNAMLHTPGGKKALAMSLMGTISMGGLVSVPLYGTVMTLCRQLAGDDPDREAYDKVAKSMGVSAADLLFYGVPSLAGVDISGSLRMELPMVRELEGNSSYAQQALDKSMLEIAGVPYSFVKQMISATEYAKQGQIARAIEDLSPTAVKNLMQASRLKAEGQTTKGGGYVYDSKGEVFKYTDAEAWAKRLGFQALRKNKAWDAYKAQKDLEQYKQDTQNKLVTRYLAAERNGSDKERKAVLKEWRDWNEDARKDKKSFLIIKPLPELAKNRTKQKKAPKDMREYVESNMRTAG